MGICLDVCAITGEMMLASRMPSGLAEEWKEKCNQGYSGLWLKLRINADLLHFLFAVSFVSLLILKHGWLQKPSYIHYKSRTHPLFCCVHSRVWWHAKKKPNKKKKGESLSSLQRTSWKWKLKMSQFLLQIVTQWTTTARSNTSLN